MNERNEMLDLMRPSASKRWLGCPASVGLQLANKDKCNNASSSFAEEGTMAHALAEAILLNHKLPDLSAYPTDKQKEMKGYAADYAEVVRAAIGPDCELLVEQKVPLFYDPLGPGGTCDAAVYNWRSNTLHIFDLKYGKGVSVVAEENTQMMIYTWGMITKMDGLYEVPENIEFTIYQPRCCDGLPAERTWSITYKELEANITRIGITARSILMGRSQSDFCVSDDTCKFCPVGAFCSARVEHLLGDLPFDAETGEAEEPATLTTEKITDILTKAKQITKLLESVEEYALRRMIAGEEKFPGFKVVQAKTRRKWIDEGKAEEFLSRYLNAKDFMELSLITPTQAQSLLKKAGKKDQAEEVYAEFSEVPPGGPTLAPVSDKRDEFRPINPREEFSDTEE